MEIGTAQPLIEAEEKDRRKSRSRLSGGGGSNNGENGRGGGGGGGSNDGDRFDRDTVGEHGSAVPDKAKFVTWFLLLVVLMTFGGLIGAYIVIATNGAAEWQPFSLPIQVWISTGLIVVSSITYQLGKNALFSGHYATSRKLMIATTALGAAFISSQILVWLALVNRGFYMRGNPYAGFFYIMTAAHAVHVIGGIIALGAIVLRTWHDTLREGELIYRRNLARSVGWYWHFMGALWLLLFGLLGFWK